MTLATGGDRGRHRLVARQGEGDLQAARIDAAAGEFGLEHLTGAGAGFAHHPVEGGEVDRRGIARQTGGGLGRGDEDEAVARHGADRERGAVAVALDEADVGGVVGDGAHHVGGVGDGEVDLGPGMGAAEGDEAGRQPQGGGGGQARLDPQDAADPAKN